MTSVDDENQGSLCVPGAWAAQTRPGEKVTGPGLGPTLTLPALNIQGLCSLGQATLQVR